MSSGSLTDDLPRTPVKKGRVSQLKEEASKSATQSTPIRHGISSTLGVEHTKSKLDPILKKEVDDMSLYVHVDRWLAAATGFAADVVEKWASVFKEKKFFEDPRISEALNTFCLTAKEPERYEPFSSILNYTLEYVEAHKVDFPGLPPSLPIKGLVYTPNDTHSLVTSGEQGRLAAKRKPDIVGVRQEAVDDRVGGAQFHWTKPVLCYELKNTGPIMGLLERRREHDRFFLGIKAAQDAQDAQSEVRCDLSIYLYKMLIVPPPPVFRRRCGSGGWRSQQHVDG